MDNMYDQYLADEDIPWLTAPFQADGMDPHQSIVDQSHQLLLPPWHRCFYGAEPGPADFMEHPMGSHLFNTGVNKTYTCWDEVCLADGECDSCESGCCFDCNILCDGENCEQEDCTPCDDDSCLGNLTYPPNCPLNDASQADCHAMGFSSPAEANQALDMVPHSLGELHTVWHPQPIQHPCEQDTPNGLHHMPQGPHGGPGDLTTAAPPIETPPLCPDELPEVTQNAVLPPQCLWLIPSGGDEHTPCNCILENCDDLQRHLSEHHLSQVNSKTGYFCRWQGCTRSKDQGFSSRNKLCRHMATHTAFKPYKCEHCERCFSAKQALEQHERIHSGEKPYACPWKDCDRLFKQKSALTMHKRTHTGEKPLQCPDCGKCFSESSNLSKHRKIHVTAGHHRCTWPDCDRQFVRLDQLKRHMGSHNKKHQRRDRPRAAKAGN